MSLEESKFWQSPKIRDPLFSPSVYEKPKKKTHPKGQNETYQKVSPPSIYESQNQNLLFLRKQNHFKILF
jgi:hypothetical protein